MSSFESFCKNVQFKNLNYNGSVPQISMHLPPLGYRNFQICFVFAEYDLFKTLIQITSRIYEFSYNLNTV